METLGKTLDEKLLEERKAVLKLENGQYKVTAYGSAGQVLEERTLSEDEYQRNLRKNRRILGLGSTAGLLAFAGYVAMYIFPEVRAETSLELTYQTIAIFGNLGIGLFITGYGMGDKSSFFERISGLKEFNNLARKYRLKPLASH